MTLHITDWFLQVAPVSLLTELVCREQVKAKNFLLQELKFLRPVSSFLLTLCLDYSGIESGGILLLLLSYLETLPRLHIWCRLYH